MFKKVDRKASRERHHLRMRRKISGTPKRPRLSAYKSEKNIYAQIIDDINSVALVSASGLDKTSDAKTGENKGVIRAAGELIAKKVLEKKISEVVFDRDGYVYHEKVQALAEAAGEASLEF